MSLNLDDIIKGSSSVDDVVSALTENLTQQQAAKGQMAQLADVGIQLAGAKDVLKWIKDRVSPGSTAGTLGNDEEYKRYVIDAAEKGEPQMTREEFNKMKERQQQQRSQSKEKA